MYSKQFPSNEEAEAYIKNAGTVKLHGRDGDNLESYIYTLTIGNTIYQISINKGYLKVFNVRYE